MSRKPKKISGKRVNSIRNRLVWLVSILIVILAVILLITNADQPVAYSREEFENIATKAEQSIAILATDGKINVEKYCSKNRPDEFSDLELFCTVNMQVLVPYGNDENARSIATRLYDEVSKLGTPLLGIEGFNSKPFNTSATLPINLGKPLPEVQCNCSIYSQDKIRSLDNSLRISMEDTLAITFYCSARAKSPYYPIRYVQS